MSRAAGLCKSCGGPRRGRAARAASPIGNCFRCNEPVCEKHSQWLADESEHGEYVCNKCIRRGVAA